MRKALTPIENYYRKFFPKRMINHKDICKRFSGETGIEIGGPSQIFTKKGFLPLYKNIKSLDNVNFSNQTVWEGSLQDNSLFEIEGTIGIQYIKEASNLHEIEDSKYSFLLSSHNIEHLANPLKTIKEWKRVVKPDGYFLFVVPNKEGTFDHLRPVTTIDHLIQDLKNDTKEDDSTHFEEVLELHDLAMDPGSMNYSDFKKRTLLNHENRCVHHHVFNLPLLKEIAIQSDIEIILAAKFSKIHLVLLGKNRK
jgi:predicted SAM-dependent methyltransferase